MLTYHQVETIAYENEDGTLWHEHCARELFGTLSVEKADAGLGNAYRLSPRSRFTLDEWAWESAREYVAEDLAEDDPGFEDAVEAAADTWHTCDHCGEPIN